VELAEFQKIAKANPVALSLKAVFVDLDRDGDGFITREELLAAFQRLGQPLSDEEASALCRHNDVNMDGKLSFDGAASQNPFQRVTYLTFTCSAQNSSR